MSASTWKPRHPMWTWFLLDSGGRTAIMGNIELCSIAPTLDLFAPEPQWRVKPWPLARKHEGYTITGARELAGEVRDIEQAWHLYRGIKEMALRGEGKL